MIVLYIVLWEHISKQIEKMEELAQKVKELVSSNAYTPDSQTDYINDYDRLCYYIAIRHAYRYHLNAIP